MPIPVRAVFPHDFQLDGLLFLVYLHGRNRSLNHLPRSFQIEGLSPCARSSRALSHIYFRLTRMRKSTAFATGADGGSSAPHQLKLSIILTRIGTPCVPDQLALTKTSKVNVYAEWRDRRRRHVNFPPPFGGLKFKTTIVQATSTPHHHPTCPNQRRNDQARVRQRVRKYPFQAVKLAESVGYRP
jgi:hypothetical protein